MYVLMYQSFLFPTHTVTQTSKFPRLCYSESIGAGIEHIGFHTIGGQTQSIVDTNLM